MKQQQIAQLTQQKANWEKQLKLHQQELKNLKPRSLLNPFGASEKTIWETQRSLSESQAALRSVQIELDRTVAQFQQWQKQTIDILPPLIASQRIKILTDTH